MQKMTANEPVVKTTLSLNSAKLKQVRAILGAESDSDAVRKLINLTLSDEEMWQVLRQLHQRKILANYQPKLEKEPLQKKAFLLPKEKLEKARVLVGTKTHSEAIRMVMEKVIAFEEILQAAHRIQARGTFGKAWDELPASEVGNLEEELFPFVEGDIPTPTAELTPSTMCATF